VVAQEARNDLTSEREEGEINTSRRISFAKQMGCWRYNKGIVD